MTSLAPNLAVFFFQQRLPVERRVSSHTTDSYAYAFKLVLVYASERLHVSPSAFFLEQIDAPLIVSLLQHLEAHRANHPSSRNVRLAAIKAFMPFVAFREPAMIAQVQRILAIPPKKAETRLVRHLTVEEIQAILDAPAPQRRNGLRDRAMLHRCFAGGLRVSELVGLQLLDLTFQPHPSILVHGKGRRERALPLWKVTATAGQRCRPAAVPKRELVQVHLQVVAPNTVVRPDEPLLQVPDGPVGQRDDGTPRRRELRPPAAPSPPTRRPTPPLAPRCAPPAEASEARAA